MFKKVLIVDDHGVINKGVLDILNDLGITDVHYALYCDDAHLKYRRAQLDKAPFDLLITDLSFKKDHREALLASGEDLIKKIRQKNKELSIIVYSMNSLLQKVRKLINIYGVNAYVCKDRNDGVILTQAINAVYTREQFLSPQVRAALQPKSQIEIDNYDLKILAALAEGLSQLGISDKLKKERVTPNSLSSVEKHLNKLKIQFKAQNAIHLVAIVKDLGLI